jgi:nucleoside-diphosphate-sugar epimerase
VTTIIHNAWRLDFNLSLASFEPAVRGTRNLLELAMQSSHAGHVRFLFTSSVAVSRSWPRNAEPFPEEPQADAQWAVGNGYGEAKYVCEQVR